MAKHANPAHQQATCCTQLRHYRHGKEGSCCCAALVFSMVPDRSGSSIDGRNLAVALVGSSVQPAVRQ